ncbi:MAG TPA: LuxR C-terminal-related transcriptional regulator [Vicinamibacterales bacterium]
MPTETQLLRLALTAYEAAVDPSVWPVFMSDYGRLLGADITLIQRHYLSAQRSELLAMFGMTERLANPYNNHYSRLNIWRERGRHLYQAGRVVFDPEMCPRPTLKRSEFYNDYLIPNFGTSHSMAGVLARQNDTALTLTGLRQDRKEGWQESDRPIVSVLLPHVARALKTQERLQILEAGETALNALNMGIIFLGADRRIVFCNDAAQRIVAQAGDGLSVRNGQLTASDSRADVALRRLVDSVVAPDGFLEPPPDVLVPRTSLRPPYHVTASALRRTLRPFIGLTAPVAALIVTDPERARPIAREALRQAYRLTPKEAALASALADGKTLEQAAAQLNVRYETARTHLRRIMSKTETSRQAELVKLLERLSR